ncbi:Hypothetical predicted protein [Cloeon dipterum]|uniref:Peptidase M13 N-terminal domain-containing protein n=1 Tax=Cloeon dipterum TaxID=197152 RepID=A0A8S1E3F6_9INSE|nr:Hypothetical predicted protein [Cloeon dipterum]
MDRCVLVLLVLLPDIIEGCSRRASYPLRQNGTGGCYSKECCSIAKSFQTTMDLSVDPCEDFYQFVCGGYTENKAVYETLDSDSEISFNLASAYNDAMNTVYSIFSNSSKEKSLLRRARWTFRLCMRKNGTISSDYSHCYNVTKSHFNYLLGAVYARNDHQEQNQEKIKKVQDMLNEVRFSYATIVNQSRWMDETIKERFAESAAKITDVIGYEPIVLDNLADDEELKKAFNPLSSDPVFSKERNAIFVPLLMMNPPVLNRGLGLKAFDYGAMGVILGQLIAQSYVSFSISRILDII